ncbi:sigma 54-interacting transcriptional regulator [Dissulfuribacter thermophilus]|uniref:sigma-54 interaction domain-containing protein n=1 Tax=Dissulfuribacter thermophilus TaxID=1156395 RepID=UPI003CC5BA64
MTQDLQRDLILDNITDGVFTIDRSGRITSFNKAAERITGYSAKEAIGKKCHEIFQSSLCGVQCALTQSIDTGRPNVRTPVFIQHKNGHIIPIRIATSPLLDHNGNILGGVETFQDQSLKFQQDIIVDSIADGVFTVDKDWRITSFNRAAEKITGHKAKEAIGKHCAEIFKSSICGPDCILARSIGQRTPILNKAITIERADGAKIPVSISASPLLDADGNLIGGVETFRDISAITALRKTITQKYIFSDIISKSPRMQKIFEILPDIAQSESNVLILGESGTGKELIARAIHNFSPRKKGPFVAVNCGAIPDTLLESELFGYKKGAFTDAKQDRPGRFAAAEKGTIFLDEIGDISMTLQVKLLRVLQEKTFEPLGSSRSIKADVRVLAATNKDLAELVKEGKFREDLFYRLNVVKIVLPPLRERLEDIPLLVDHFIKKLNLEKAKDIQGISDAALNLLMRYDYPGNIRELENIIEYAFILCRGQFIEPEHLPEPFAPENAKIIGRTPFSSGPKTLEEIEKEAIIAALERNNWKKMATCKELGISKDTLRRKIKRYGLKRE